MRNILEKIKELFKKISSALLKIKPIFEKIAKFLEPVTSFVKKNDEVFRPIFVLTVICIIISSALSLTNSLTVDRIAAINLENKNKEMSALLPADNYLEVHFKSETVKNDTNFSIYKALNGEELEGYIVTTSAKGYGGEIVVMTAFDNANIIKAISILNADNETPGLGQNVKTEEFTSQFKGVIGKAEVVKTAPDKSSGEIKAVTGATISSKGTVNAVNIAKATLQEFQSLPSNQNNGGGADE